MLFIFENGMKIYNPKIILIKYNKYVINTSNYKMNLYQSYYSGITFSRQRWISARQREDCTNSRSSCAKNNQTTMKISEHCWIVCLAY